MDISEFKAWFEGFTEDMSGQPNAKQWKRIKARVKQIDGTATTERVFIDRYWDRYRPYWAGQTWCSTGGNQGLRQFSSNVNNMTAAEGPPVLNANLAFTALGKAEAQSITA